MRNNRKKYVGFVLWILGFVIFAIVPTTLYAQDEIESQEIFIVKDFNVFIEEATKIKPQIDYNVNFQEKMAQEELTYTLSERVENFVFQPQPIRPINFTQKEPLATAKNYVKAGLGSLLNPLLEWNHTIFSENQKTNLYAKHHSAWVQPESFQSYANTTFMATSQISKNNIQIAPFIGFDSKKYNFFGNVNESNFKDNAGRFYNGLNLGVKLSKERLEEKKMSFQAEFGGDYGFESLDKNTGSHSNSEYRYYVNGQGKYNYSKAAFLYLNAGVEVSQTNFGVQTHRSLLNLNPEVQYSNKSLKFLAGINFYSATLNGSGSFYALPRFESEVQLVPKYITFFTIWHRTLQTNRLSQLLNENPFVVNENSVLPISRVERRAGGFKGNFNKFSYQASVTQKIIKDALLFANDSLNPRFLNAVVEKNLTSNNVSLELSYKSSLPFDFTLKNDFYFYELDNLPVAYNLPSIVTNLGVLYKHKPNWIFQLDAFAVSGVKSIIKGAQVSSPLQLDLNIGTEYGFKNNIFLFGQVNNCLNTKVTRIIGYPSYGVNAQVGVRWLY
jgi:hypothetical protein